MTDLSRKTVLFYDPSAGYSHMAEAVVGDFAAVKYYSFWETAFPNAKNLIPGIGVEGIERVSDFFTALDKADLVVFPDVGNAGLQEYLRGQGVPVFGSGRGAILEQNRWHLKQTARDAGIDISDAFLIHGMDNLRELLMRQDDLYIKVSYLRGDMESFHHRNYLSSKPWINDVSLRMGPYGSMVDFIVELPIEGDDCVEVGADTAYCCDGKYPETILWGYEAKDAAYCGTIHALPERVRDVLDKLSPILASHGYRGPLSTETRETPDNSYLIDMTCRFPEPPSSVHRFMVSNWGEVMYGAATGDPVEPEYIGQYAVQLVLRSQWGAEHPLPVEVGMPERVTLHGHCVIDKQHYAVSPSEIEEIGGACGIGNSLSDATEEALEAAKSVEGFQLSWDEAALRKLTDTIRDGNKLGLMWGKPKGEDDGREESRTD